MPTTLPPTITPRVVDHADATSSTRSSWRPPTQALRGALAGAEAAIGSWLVVAVVAIAGYVATAAAPELGSAGWIDAARVGSAIWLLGHGGALSFAGASITLVPVGVSLVALAGVAASVRRVRPATWWPVGAAVLAYTALAVGFAALAGTPGSWRGVLGAPVLAAAGCLVAMRGRIPADLSRLLARIPAAVRAGVGAGARGAAMLLALGALALVLALVLGFSRVMDVHRALVPDTVSSVIIVLAQVMLAPTLVVWVVGFLAGPGFAVGQGTSFAPSGVDAGPLPVVPVLGALPEPGNLPGVVGLVVVLGVLVGALAGVWLRRRRPARLAATAIAVAVTALTAALVIGALAAVSSGSVGPGRMAEVGPDALAVGIAVAWQVALGAAITALLLHPESRVLAGRGRDAALGWWRTARER
ncbi:cell division protein PerM [Pseudactinotalea suaedae]|uniref:cell division protein PerM n=1 Tax=Pseudactinotalea suaedae TaxID=1524924 RepID=UPI0012E12748|nr:DUF6350 family protein [Pseudactinotalea suaedae]